MLVSDSIADTSVSVSSSFFFPNPGILIFEANDLPIPNGIVLNMNVIILVAIKPTPKAAAIFPAANITSGAAIAATIIPPRLFLIASTGFTPVSYTHLTLPTTPYV